ncbi:VQ motif-containing protein 25 [Argentina anserina]|uniref:VQ motif-containing protein 25 n=1 Tax=Argentina anserina TaxID=57926 RepID=UPI0021767E10|nr:VQ motif-containing protein 25 [Potentilla anserina]
MEEVMLMSKKQTWGARTPSLCSNALAIHSDSQTISKPKPKIRIIHIFAPEIIKTDVANFRELVQRLTGKPSENDGWTNKKKRVKGGVPSRGLEAHQKSSTTFMAEVKKMELGRSNGGGGAGFRGLEQFPRSERVIKEEEMMWNAENSGGFLERFADLEGFIQELGEFPLLPNLESASNSHLLHGFEGTQLE